MSVTAPTMPGVSSAPGPLPIDRPTSNESLVTSDSHFDGLYRTKQNLRVEGIAEGEIECEGTLTVAKGARVRAKVTARNITVAGELEGEVTCQETFQIMPTGQIQATVVARRLIVQEGGLYNGEFRMITEQMPVRGSERSTPRSAERPAGGRRADDWLSRLSSTEPSSETKDDESQ